ncbi:MAG TPA: MBL fold metallo-hydrolase [Myxococcales bacterium]|nr:MBL fold metallo-hydrolase [Myxococcales bacterium]
MMSAGLIANVGCAGLGARSTVESGGMTLTSDSKPATAATRAANQKVARSLPFDHDADFELAKRGRLATDPGLQIAADDGTIAWDMTNYAFEKGDAPDTVNPSLWRQAKLNMIHGLFQVVDGIYQVRGYDLSNISFVRGDTGWIVLDPLITVEAARAALDLVNETLGERPVVAVIYSHSHVDHFGGVRGVTTREDVEQGRVRIIAPEGFMQHSVSENVLAGNVMTRRAAYMFGRLLPAGERGRIDAGLGKTTSIGRVSIIEPTDVIHKTGTTLTIDGVEIVFQYTPNAEAPAEFMFYFPQRKAFYAAEEASAVLHNLYTLRGAQVRNGSDWARWLDEAIDLFGGDLEVVFGGHHWPRWGRAEAVAYLASQRDLYKYIHDQTLHLANMGLTPLEIAEQLRLPDELGREWFNRGYYGTVSHNSKATYQLYLGFFDGNPANLNPHPPEQAGRRYVELAGGAEALLDHARVAYDRGDYRWVAEVVKHLVFAEPSNRAARWLEADALEQLGYQAESGPWRNFYLTGAQELRATESAKIGTTVSPTSSDILAGMSSDLFFDYLAIGLKGEEAADVEMTVELEFPDRDEQWLLEIAHGVLRYYKARRAEDPTIVLRISRADFVGVLSGAVSLPNLLLKDQASLDGGLIALARFGRLFERFSPAFEIVKP